MRETPLYREPCRTSLFVQRHCRLSDVAVQGGPLALEARGPTREGHDRIGIAFTSASRETAAKRGRRRSWLTSKTACRIVETRWAGVKLSVAGSPPSRVD